MLTRFILIETSHPGNVGAAARALKVMGFCELVLVAPRWANVLCREETIQRASGALDVLNTARIVETLDQALEGLSHLCATVMVPRDFGPPTHSPRQHLSGLAQQAPAPVGVGFLFGSERYGLKNDEVYRCHAALSIPTAPGFGSLNLASAIQVIAYEWRMALGGFAPRSLGAPADTRADAQAVAALLEHWEQVLVDIEFLDPQSPKKLMPRLQQICNRVQFSTQEVQILRGVARQIALKTSPKRLD